MICEYCGKDFGEKLDYFVLHNCRSYAPYWTNSPARIRSEKNLANHAADNFFNITHNRDRFAVGGYGIMQYRCSGRGVDYYDDHTSTSPQQFYNRFFHQRIENPILCIGGEKEMDFINVVRLTEMIGCKEVILFGSNGLKLSTQGVFRETASGAAFECKNRAAKGDTVIFSPLSEGDREDAELFFEAIRYWL